MSEATNVLTPLGAALSRPFPLGVSKLSDGSVNVAVWAPDHRQIMVYVREPGQDWRGEALPEFTDGVHHGTLTGFVDGTEYGFHSDDVDPKATQLWLDPYATAVGAVSEFNDGGKLSGVFLNQDFDWGDDAAPRIGMRESVLYELHVKGFSQLNPAIDEELRGTYAGLAHPASIEHLKKLGVTAVELLPVHVHLDEKHLRQLGLPNYWGYNTLNFFAPHPGYATKAAQNAGLRAVQDEFKGMVKLLHAAGIEVILDVVYNHTAEGPLVEPALSWRGLAPDRYYRFGDDGRYADTTGCGNSLDFSQPRVVQLAMDSLRHWVKEYHVDGFRFDLATTLGRDRTNSFTPTHPFLIAASTSQTLAGVKLISEPWDVGYGGWQTGNFPEGFSDWNDRFRDTVREIWLGDTAKVAHGHTPTGLAPLADAFFGNASLFAASRRGILASVNFVTAHDGFTMADLCAYNHKHNEANREDNADGTNNNHSWNHGVEGPSDDPQIQAARRRSAANMLATLILSFGVPMLTAGDEFGRSQGGNNNAYCQDSEISWVRWDEIDQGLFDLTRRLIRVRKDFYAAQPSSFPSRDSTAQVQWRDSDGSAMTSDRWHDPKARVLQVLLGAPGGALTGLVVFNASAHDQPVRLPESLQTASLESEQGSDIEFEQRFTTADSDHADRGKKSAGGQERVLPAHSVTVFRLN